MRSWLALAPLSAAGMLAAHDSAYRVVTFGHHSHATEHLLEATGHGWQAVLPQAWLAIAVLLVVAGWGIAAGRSRSPRLWELVAVQFGAYATVEVLERLSVGANPWPGWALLAAGLLTQLPAAACAWMVLNIVVVPALAFLRTSPLTLPGVHAAALSVPVATSSSAPRCGQYRPAAGRAPPRR